MTRTLLALARAYLVRSALVLTGALLAVIAFVLPASAATSAEQAAAPAAVAFTIDPAAVVQLLVAFVLPVAVGLVTTRVTSGARKAWYLAGLTLLTSVLVELGRTLTAGGTFDVGVALHTALPAFVVSVSTHYGLWKPTGVAAAAQHVGAARHAA